MNPILDYLGMWSLRDFALAAGDSVQVDRRDDSLESCRRRDGALFNISGFRDRKRACTYYQVNEIV
jgi:hypothetical protein